MQIAQGPRIQERRTKNEELQPPDPMPIAMKPSSDGSNLLEVVVSGALSHQDYELFLPRVERMVKEHGKIRVLMDMVDFHGWETGALWDDTKFTLQHFGHIERIAMVGDHPWEKWMSTFCRPFTSAEVRYFDWRELKAARAWLDEPLKVGLRHAAMGCGV